MLKPQVFCLCWDWGPRGTAVLDETVCSDAGRQKISILESVVGGLMCHGGRARVLVV